MNYTGYSVLKVTKDDAAYAYGLDAYSFATGATGVGGYLNSHAGSSINFIHGITSGNYVLPDNDLSLTNVYTGQATIIGGATPNGDIRGEATGFYKYGTTEPYSVEKNTQYSGALYAVYSDGSTPYYYKIGIGTTTSEINTSGYYEGDFTTRSIYEFNSVYNADLDDPTKIITGSGVYRNGSDVSLQFNILNRNGELLTSASQIAADPFVERQIISILDSDSNVVFPSYRINGNSTFTFSRSQNIDVFGSYNRNFGIRNEIVNADGGTSTGEFYLYANTATFNQVIVQASGETSLNENLTNHFPPDTGSITSATDRADAIKYFNDQPINASGSTGFIGLTLDFNESLNFTNLGDLTIWNGTSGDFATNIDNLVGNYPLNAIQEGQQIRLRTDDGIQEKTPLFFKLMANSDVGFEPEILTIGPYTLEPIAEGVDLNLYNQGEQLLVGNFTVAGGLDGYETDGGNLSVSGEGDFSRKIGAEGRVLRTRINTDGYSIKTQDKAVISAYDSNIYSTGSAIMGGSGHIISGDFDLIGGGSNNKISGCDYAFIGGGTGIDIIDSQYSSSIGGYNNDISGSSHSVIGGGHGNYITTADGSFIGAGFDNIAEAPQSVIGGGVLNKTYGNGYSFIGGGESNEIYSVFGAILGGENNTVSGWGAAIAGGEGNTASGKYSFIGGGQLNEAYSDYSYAFGKKAKITSSQSGAAVFTDGNDIDTLSSGAHTATLNFENGVYVQTTSGLYVNGNPVMTGVNPYDEDTLQTVTDRGNETTTSIISTGPHISGVAGLFNSNVGIGTNNPSAKLDIHTATNSNGLFIREDTDDSITHNFYVDSSDNGVGVLYADGQSAKITLNTAGDSYFNGGNIGIGIATPAQKLEVFEGYIRVGDASNGGYGIEFERNSAIVGLINTANNRINIQASNNRDVELRDTAGTGNLILKHGGDVGIGTVSPVAKLHVYNSAGGDATDKAGMLSEAVMKLQPHASNSTNMLFAQVNSGSGMGIQVTNGPATANWDIALSPFGGNVGIGTTNPISKLHVVGGDLRIDQPYSVLFANGQTIRDNSNGGLAIRVPIHSLDLIAGTNAGNGHITFQTNNGTERMRVSNGGNVGIGVAGPEQKLHVANGSALLSSTSDHQRLYIRSTSSHQSIIYFGDSDNAAQGRVAYNNSSDQMYFNTLGSTKMTILSGGNVGIGTTNPSRNDYSTVDPKLHVKQAGTNGAYNLVARFEAGGDQNDTGSSILINHSNDRGLLIEAGRETGDVGIAHLGILNSAGSNSRILTLKQGGNVGIGITNPASKLHVDGTVQVGVNDTGYDVKFYGDDSGEYMEWDASEARLNIIHTDESAGLQIFTNAQAQSTQPQIKIGRNGVEYWGVFTDDRHAHLVHRQDETSGTMTTRFDQWDSNTSDTAGEWLWRFGGGDGSNIATAMKLTQAGNLTVSGGIQMANDADTASASKVGTMRYRIGTEYVDVDGVELVTNGDFDSATGWNLNSNWSISGGTCNADGTSNADINQNLVLGVVGQNYRITYVISAYTQGSIAARIGSGITDYNTGTGTFTQVVTATTTDRIRMNLTSNFIGSVDSLSIVKVTAEEASYADMCMQTATSTYEWVNIVKNSY